MCAGTVVCKLTTSWADDGVLVCSGMIDILVLWFPRGYQTATNPGRRRSVYVIDGTNRERKKKKEKKREREKEKRGTRERDVYVN